MNIMNNQLSVSIVITAYNRPDYLYSALESCLNQTYEIKEIIIIDDCSAEDLKTVAYSFDDNRVHYYRQKTNSGANAARNKGIELANGDFIAFLDDDDIWKPEKIKQQMQSLGDDFVGSLCNFEYMDRRNKIDYKLEGIVTKESLKTGNKYCGTSGLLASRSVLENENFDINLPSGQDWDMYIRLINHGKVSFVNYALFEYRYGSHESISTKTANISLSKIEYKLKAIIKHRQFLGENNYRTMVARRILAGLPNKSNKLSWLNLCVKYVGIYHTLLCLVTKIKHNRKIES